MNLAQRVVRGALQFVIRNAGIGSSRELQDFLFGRGPTESETGMVVNEDTAMRVASVYACVRVLSEDIAKLPILVYQHNADGTKTPLPKHWMNTLLEYPNAWQTGFEFREMQQAHIELSGNFYAIKTLVGRQVTELLPIAPWRIEVKMTKDWQIHYIMTGIDGIQRPVPSELMYHVRGMSLDGIVGISPIGYQRDTVGLAMALRKFGNMAFKNGATFSGVLQHPGIMEDQAWKRLKESFESNYAGLNNAHKMLLLEEGTTFQQTGMTLKDAQYLDARKYSRSEIAAIYRVPLHMIQDIDRATFSNIEQLGRDYVTNGLLSRIVRLEKRMLRSLLPVGDQRLGICVEHQLDSLQRGDYESRMRAYQIAVSYGWLNRNEVRAMENLNPGPADLNIYMVPANFTSADQLGEKFDPNAVPADDPSLKKNDSYDNTDPAAKNAVLPPVINVTVAAPPAPDVRIGDVIVHNDVPMRVRQQVNRDPESQRVTSVEDIYDHPNRNGRSSR